MTITPAARWRENGETDPHKGGHYDGERATLCNGHMTDDELANEVYLRPGIANLTAAKERIRWLSRRLEESAGGWVSIEDQLPKVALGEQMHCWLLCKSKILGEKVFVVDVYFINKPIAYVGDPADGEVEDWVFSNDGDPVEAVGWFEKYKRGDYNGWYEAISDRVAPISWMPIIKPSVS